MKSEADPRRRPFFSFFRVHCILGQKVHYLGTISSEDFFLETTAFLGQKMHYLGMISSDDLFFRDYLESKTKIGLEHLDIRTKN